MHPRATFLNAATAGVCGLLVGCAGTSHRDVPREPADKPNVVLLFVDDMGYSDVGVYGAEGWETPNLDRLAAQGTRFTNFYVAQPVCSASRAALLTGCYPNRIGITGALGPNAKHGISDDEMTMAEMLKAAGYATGCYGKWHLGHHEQFLPLQHGFDDYLGLPYSNDMWPVNYDGTPVTADKDGGKPWKLNYPPLPLIDGNETVEIIETLEDQAALTTRCTERALDFIDGHADEPFFLYVPYSMVHVPLGVSEKFAGSTEQGMYGDTVAEIDWSVGQIMRSLDRHGIDDDTIVIFTSDNGPWLNYGNHAGTCRPLREGKGTTFEGGVREPCIVRWPGRVPAGAVSDVPFMTIDLMPTLAAITGAELPEHTIDGKAAVDVLTNEPGATSPQEAYFFYYHRNNLEAMRWGKWKLHFPHGHRSYVGVEPGNDGFPGPYARRQTGLELYDLDTDIGETTSVAAAHPDVVEKMTAMADAMRADLGDALTETEPTGHRQPGRLR
jgi:arylsulfatase A-like enzyme